jgi:hypothetical protein
MDYKRTVNKNYLMAQLKMHGLTLKTLALSLDPPITESCMCKLSTIGHPYKNEGRIKQVASALHADDIHLFPFMPAEKKVNSKNNKA